MRVLLIGGLGFIGKALFHHFTEVGAEVSIVARKEEEGFPVIVADAFDIPHYRKELLDADIICNLIGSRTVKPEETEVSWRTNCHFSFQLLETLKEEKSHALLVHFGSRLQYGEQEMMPVQESVRMFPSNIYGLHKQLAEEYHLLYARLGVRVLCLRISNVYGPDQEHGIVAVMRRRLEKGAFTIQGDPSRLKDFIHVDDVARAIVTATIEKSLIGEVLNIGSGFGISFEKATRLLRDKLKRGEIAFADMDVDDPSFVADISKITRLTGWKPEKSFPEGMLEEER